MNLQIIEAVVCKKVLTSVSICIECPFYLGRDEIVNEILCSNENKKSRKKEYEEMYESFYKEGGIIEFGQNKD